MTAVNYLHCICGSDPVIQFLVVVVPQSTASIARLVALYTCCPCFSSAYTWCTPTTTATSRHDKFRLIKSTSCTVISRMVNNLSLFYGYPFIQNIFCDICRTYITINSANGNVLATGSNIALRKQHHKPIMSSLSHRYIPSYIPSR